MVGKAYLEARALVPTDVQLRWAANEKLAESATAFLAQIGPHDTELLAALRRGLTLMARGVVCRVDDFAARDFILGSKITAWVLGFYDVADAESVILRTFAFRARWPSSSVRPPPTSRPLPRAQTLPEPPRRGPRQTADTRSPRRLSRNLKRRHLTESQRALVAAKLANMQSGERTSKPWANWPKVSISQPEAAKRLSVGTRTVKRARAVLDSSLSMPASASVGWSFTGGSPRWHRRKRVWSLWPLVPLASPTVAFCAGISSPCGGWA